MEAAVYEQTSIDIAGGRFLLRTFGSVVVFRGFLQVYDDVKEEEKEENGENGAVPQNLQIGETLTLLDVHPKQHFTKPPARYTESSLVKELDALAIGRPSTYALIISTLLARKYIDKQGRQLIPSDLGKTVNKILIQNFPQIFNVKFTAFMEDELDKVEAGDKPFLQVVKEFYEPFNQAVVATEEKKDTIKDALQEVTEEVCPKCGKPLVIRWGRNGKFMACSGYPDCKHTKPLEALEKVEGEVCEKCGKDMVLKIGRYGRFLACSGYPDCSNARPYPIGVACPLPNCGGKIIERRSKRGRTFYGCSNYPACNFVSWSKPVAKPCPNCANNYLEERYTQAEGAHLRCPKCKGKFEQSADALYEPAALE
jgi:DNA topoisomerase-1